MRLSGFIVCLFFVAVSWGQNSRYYEWLDRTERDSIKIKAPSQEQLNVINFDRAGFSGKLLHELNAQRTRKGRSEWKLNDGFMQVCNVGVKHFSKSFFKKSRKYRHKITRYTEFGLRHMDASCRMFKAFTFYVNLTNLKRYSRYYYSRKDDTSPLRLYMGKRPRISDPDHEEYEKPVPVKPLTEDDFIRTLISSIKSASNARELVLRRYSEIGIAMRLDEHTINRRKPPHAFVMVIVGGRQLQEMKTVDPAKRLPSDNYDPYIVIP
jgi:hypothetical protein